MKVPSEPCLFLDFLTVLWYQKVFQGLLPSAVAASIPRRLYCALCRGLLLTKILPSIHTPSSSNKRIYKQQSSAVSDDEDNSARAAACLSKDADQALDKFQLTKVWEKKILDTRMWSQLYTLHSRGFANRYAKVLMTLLACCMVQNFLTCSPLCGSFQQQCTKALWICRQRGRSGN